MESLLALLVGGLVTVGVYLLLGRGLVQVIIGVSLLTNAVNLMIFTVGGLTRGNPPLVPEGSEQPGEIFANPIPQALILTAIVIGFGVLAFILALAYRALRVADTVDVDDLRATDRLTPPTDAY